MTWGSNIWTSERVAWLKKNYHTGIAAEVAREMSAFFGIAISRNAILGKGHRLGLTGFREDRLIPIPVARRIIKLPVLRAPPVMKPRKLPPEPVVVCEPLHVTLMHLEDAMCKWMTSLTTYCGCATGHKKESYCRDHAAVGRVEPRKRWA